MAVQNVLMLFVSVCVTSCKLSASLPSKVSVFTNYISLEVTDVTLFNQHWKGFLHCVTLSEKKDGCRQRNAVSSEVINPEQRS